ncbi:MAG: hypothetical protein KUG82_07380 [Pseudomonadales bacterium]|nr:hypothetical protein [Pseudomonadales bacterium]
MAANNHLSSNTEWIEYLIQQGADLNDDTPVSFGNPSKEREVASSLGNIITNLDQTGLLEVKGEEARQFLQGQITSDLDLVSTELAALGCYVNLQGRAIASFRVIQLDDQDGKDSIPCFLLSMPISLVPIVMARLQKYIVFSKAELQDVSSQWIKLGLSGPDASQFIQTEFNTALNNENCPTNTTFQDEGRLAVTLSSALCPRYEIYCNNAANATKLWQAWSKTSTPVGSINWLLQDIRSGDAAITEIVSEAVMPAELGYDRNGGISFTKGCYTGQEIVARLHYKGTPKQDLYLIKIDFDLNKAGFDKINVENNDLTVFDSGTKVTLSENLNTVVGTIISAAPASSNSIECLAVLKIAKAESANLGVDSTPVTVLKRIYSFS